MKFTTVLIAIAAALIGAHAHAHAGVDHSTGATHAPNSTIAPRNMTRSTSSSMDKVIFESNSGSMDDNAIEDQDVTKDDSGSSDSGIYEDTPSPVPTVESAAATFTHSKLALASMTVAATIVYLK